MFNWAVRPLSLEHSSLLTDPESGRLIGTTCWHQPSVDAGGGLHAKHGAEKGAGWWRWAVLGWFLFYDEHSILCDGREAKDVSLCLLPCILDMTTLGDF